MRAGETESFRRNATSLLLFGIAFGFVEAAVVVYLRAIYEPLRRDLGLNPTDLFPLLTLEQIAPVRRLLIVELCRELATIVMLASAALAAARNFPTWLAGFAVAFGAWDIAFYAGLKAILDWPASVLTWDLLFLLPVPWAGPVLAPLLVSISLIAGGVLILAKKHVEMTWWHRTILVGGGLIVVLSFTLDAGILMEGGMPKPFRWWLFAIGEGMGIVALAAVCRRTPKQVDPLSTAAQETAREPLPS